MYICTCVLVRCVVAMKPCSSFLCLLDELLVNCRPGEGHVEEDANERGETTSVRLLLRAAHQFVTVVAL